MPLLKLSDLKSLVEAGSQVDHPAPFPAVSVACDAVFIVGRHGVDLNTVLPELHQDRAYLLWTRGDWSLHEMIALVLERVGVSRVWLTSWGISQEPLQSILQLKLSGQISQLNCLFDSRVKLECPQAFQLLLAAENVNVRLGKNHSKVVVLMNKEHAITIVSSANLTVNPRMETYVVLTHRNMAEACSTLIDLEMAGANPFSNAA